MPDRLDLEHDRIIDQLRALHSLLLLELDSLMRLVVEKGSAELRAAVAAHLETLPARLSLLDLLATAPSEGWSRH